MLGPRFLARLPWLRQRPVADSTTPRDEPGRLLPPAAGPPERPSVELTTPVGERLVDERPPPVAKDRQGVLGGPLLGDDVALEDGAIQAGRAQHAPQRAVEEAGPGRLSSQVEHRIGPTPPVAVEVPEAPPPQLGLVVVDHQPPRGWAPDGDAALGHHAPGNGIDVESTPGRELAPGVGGDGHHPQLRPAQVGPPDEHAVARERPSPGHSEGRRRPGWPRTGGGAPTAAG
jgi:hypothetical protein